MYGNEFRLQNVMKKDSTGNVYTWDFPRHKKLYWFVNNVEIVVSRSVLRALPAILPNLLSPVLYHPQKRTHGPSALHQHAV